MALTPATTKTSGPRAAPAPRPPHVPVSTFTPSVFAALKKKAYRFRYAVQLEVGHLVGGTPTNRKVAEGWIRTKMGETSEEQIQAAVEETMKARGITAPKEAAQLIAEERNLSGFKRDFTTVLAKQAQDRAVQGVKTLNRDNEHEYREFTREEAESRFGELYFEGRQLKAMIKEAASIALSAGTENGGLSQKREWGATKKGISAFLVEHMFIPDEKVLLGVVEPSRVAQSFVHTWRGAGIKMEEIIDDAVLDFEIHCDFDFESVDPNFWGAVFVRGEMNGLGSSRSQGFGTFSTTRFDRLT